MSLINEALKKAQKQRTQEQAPLQPPMPGGGPAPVIKRRQPRSARAVVWSVIGGVSLIVFSIAFTILFLSQDEDNAVVSPRPVTPPKVAAAPQPNEAAPAPAPTPAPDALSSTPTPVVATPPAIAAGPTPQPVVPPPAESATPGAVVTFAPIAPATPAETARPSAPAPQPVAITLPAEPVAAATTQPAVAPNPAAPIPAQPDTKVYELIDTLRVAGIRASATDPKVLMNDRVFRLNDLVDRATGLRLVKIEASCLTFVDAAGAVYTKNF